MRIIFFLVILSLFLIGCTPVEPLLDVPDTSSASSYVAFEQNAYEQALRDGKIILLDFYASWCPICRAENPHLRAGIADINDPRLIAYQVHYNDDETTLEEKNLAQEFGVTYQHTKIILKNGQVVLKSLEQWNKEKTIEELRKVL